MITRLQKLFSPFLLLTVNTLAFSIGDLHKSPEIGCTGYLKTVSTGDTSVTLFALPVVYSFGIGKNARVDATTTAAAAFSTIDESFTGRLSATKLRFIYNANNLFLSTLGARIPVAENRFSEAQSASLGRLSARQMNIQYTDLYNSFDINAGLSSSLFFRDVGDGDLTIALALSYLYRGETEPLKVTDAIFYPGQEFTTTLGADYTLIAFERRFDLAADAIYTMYGSDSYAGGETYSRGSSFQWALSISSSVTEKLPLAFRISNYLRSPSETPFGNTGKSADLFLTMSTQLPFLISQNPLLSLTFSSYAGGGIGRYGDATTLSLNAAFEKTISERTTVVYSVGIDAGTFENRLLFGIGGALQLKFTF